ncbi:MAG: hypothetical protein Q9162_000206 [Coniocarpon cinnabarinum]
MGQGYSMTTLSAGSAGIDVPELSHLSYEKSLGEARFMKTIRARHRHGLVAVKVAMKPYSNMSFQKYIRKIMYERKILMEIPNALSYHNVFETNANGYLTRQYVYSSLYDRISTRPFLEDVEKCWLAFQLLSVVRDCHSRQLYHGDIKTENVLVTSWNWLFLTDFSSAFKPAYLPEDNPAEFAFYFDIAGRRTCYLAPERFLHGSETQRASSSLTWAMDIFSVGCVVAELFLETPIFNLSQLFNYRKGEYDPRSTHLNRIENTEIREMVAHMIQLEPESRYSADEYLNFWREKAFPGYFSSFLHQYMALITDPASGRLSITADEMNLGESDDRISRVYHDFDKIAYFLGYANSHIPELSQVTSLLETYPFTNTPNLYRRHLQELIKPVHGSEGTFLFLNIVTSSLRSTARATARLQACDLLVAFSLHIRDEAKLDRVLPFLMTMLDDSAEVVKIAALRSMTLLISLVTSTSPVNAFVFPEYILPKLSEMFSVRRGRMRQGTLVRLTFAQCLAALAESGAKFLDSTEALKFEGSLPSATADAVDGISPETYREFYDSIRAELLRFFETHTKQFLTDPEPGVRRAFLGSIGSLCVFFGSAKTNDVLLSHLNTYLNSRDWKLKCSFFDAIVGVAVYVGSNNVEEFVLPLMTLALLDPEEAVMRSVLRSIAVMASLGLFQRSTALGLVELIVRFTIHPNDWIREASSDFLASATYYLSPADRQCRIVPLLRPLLRLPLAAQGEVDFMDALQKPLNRDVYDLTLAWARISEGSSFWRHIRKIETSNKPADRFFILSVHELNGTSFAKAPKSELDQQWIGRLHDAGMTREDELKLLAISEHVLRVTSKPLRDSATEDAVTYDKQVKLNDFKVQVNTFQIDPEEDIWDHDDRASEPTDPEQTLKPQTISDALLDASATIEFGEQIPETPVNDLTDEGSSSSTVPRQRSAKPLQIRSAKSAQPSPNDSEAASIDERVRSRKAHRGSAIDLIQRRNIAGKASPELATSPANAQGHVNAHVNGQDERPEKRRPTNKGKSEGMPHSRLLALSGYAGRDPNVLRLLESLAVANHPPNLLDLGPEVTPIDKRKPIQRGVTPQAQGAANFHGHTIAMFSEHTASINRVLVSSDHVFFLTASDDGTVKTWDSCRLERNVAHRSRQTYKHAPGVRVSALTILQHSHVFASAGSDGSLHLVRVDVNEISPTIYKYNKVRLLRSWRIPGDGSYAIWLEHLKTRSSNTLFMATNRGKIHALNIDTMSMNYTLEVPSHHGMPTCFCVARDEPKWLLLGTSKGVLDLWDLRFHVRLHSLQFPAEQPITRISPHPNEDEIEKVLISGGLDSPEVTEWSIQNFNCMATWRTAGALSASLSNAHKPGIQNTRVAPDTRPYILNDMDQQGKAKSVLKQGEKEEMTPAEVETSGAFSMHCCVRSFVSAFMQDLSNNTSGSRGSLDATETLYLFTAGPDASLRLWNLGAGKTHRSLVISAPSSHDGEEVTTRFEEAGSWSGIKFHNETNTSQTNERGDRVSEIRRQANKGTSNASRKSLGEGEKNGESAKDAVTNPESGKKSSSAQLLSQQGLLREHLDVVTDVAVIHRPYRMFIDFDNLLPRTGDFVNEVQSILLQFILQILQTKLEASDFTHPALVSISIK